MRPGEGDRGRPGSRRSNGNWPRIRLLAEEVRSGVRTAAATVETAVNRVQDVLSGSDSVCQPLVERAIRRAALLDSGGCQLESTGLLGVPFVAKGNMRVRGEAGYRCSYLDTVVEDDADVISGLEAHGAVLVGVTRYTELALASSEAEIDGGAVANPNQAGRTVGGSSSGSAAAVRQALVPFAVGTDTGGSVRIPAAFAGVAGLKPTDDLLSKKGVMPVSWTLDQVGLLARSAADISDILEVLSASPPPGSSDSVVVGMVGEAWNTHPRTDETALRTFQLVGSKLRSRVTITEVEVVAFADCQPTLSGLVSYEAARSHGPAFELNPTIFGGFVRERLHVGSLMSTDEYRHLLEERDRYRAIVIDILRQVDVLLLPTVPFVPPPYEEVLRLGSADHALLTRLANLAGLPAVSVPAGWDENGLPLAMQVVGRPGEDDVVLAIASLIEEPYDRAA